MALLKRSCSSFVSPKHSFRPFSSFSPKPPKKILIDLPIKNKLLSTNSASSFSDSTFTKRPSKNSSKCFLLKKSHGTTLSLKNERRNKMHQLAICPMSSKQSTLKAYKRLKYLNVKEISDLTSDQLDTGFLKNKPKKFLVLKSKNELKNNLLGRNSSRRKTKSLGNKVTLEKQDNDENTKNDLSIVQKIKNVKNSKIFLANINKSKQTKIAHLIDKNDVSPMSQRTDSSTSTQKGFSVKRFSMMDRFILKLVDPDECIEDYVNESDKPFDKYTKFKRQCAKEKKRLSELINDLNKAVSLNQNLLKIYTTQLKSTKRFIKGSPQGDVSIKN